MALFYAIINMLLLQIYPHCAHIAAVTRPAARRSMPLRSILRFFRRLELSSGPSSIDDDSTSSDSSDSDDSSMYYSDDEVHFSGFVRAN
jgi:hypothetical protein